MQNLVFLVGKLFQQFIISPSRVIYKDTDLPRTEKDAIISRICPGTPMTRTISKAGLPAKMPGYAAASSCLSAATVPILAPPTASQL